MRKTLTALALAATIAIGTLAAPGNANAGGRDWWGPAIIGGFAAGAIIGSQLARPSYPGPVYYEYAQPGPVYYEYYAPPPAYYAPAPVAPCWRWHHGYRHRVC